MKTMRTRGSVFFRKKVDSAPRRGYNIKEKCFNKYFYLTVMEKRDKLYIGLFNDYYGALLTEYQRGLIDMYYNKDMSLGEIAQVHDISPQGVSDALKRAERTLTEAESKLKLVEKSDKLRKILRQISACGDEEIERLAQKAIDVLDS